jgi:hypothetical protein
MTTTSEVRQVIRHKLAHPKGGMSLLDEGNVVKTVVKDMAGKIAKKIAKGELSDILKTPAPAYIHYPRTYLEGACMDLSYSSKYLTAAARTDNPIERMKNVICMYVGGQHINPAEM